MQEIKFPNNPEPLREFFHGDDAEAQMDNRLQQVRGERGHPTTVKRRKVGRNEPCPCGSGTKFKKCCLRRTETA